MSDTTVFPRSPKDEIDGLIYFPRMLDKIRLHLDGKLHADYHDNMGKALDQYTCDLLQVDYVELAEKVLDGADDKEVLEWAYNTGCKAESPQKDWWCSYVRNLGFNDHLSDVLAQRISDAGFSDRADLNSFLDFIDAEEGHSVKPA